MRHQQTTGLLLCLLMAAAGISCRHQTPDNRYEGLDSALVSLYQQMEKHPKNAELHMKIADYYRMHLLPDSALTHALTALRLDSTKSRYYVQISDIYLMQKDFDMCEEMLEKAIRLDKEQEEAYLKLAELHFMLRRYDEATEVIKRSLAMNEYNPKAHFIIGWIQREQGDTAAAIRSYMKAAEQDAEYFEAYEELAHLYHVRLNPLAIQHYQNALRIRPDDILTLYNLAMFYQETGDDKQAMEQYRNILQKEPNNQYALHNMGWICMNRLKNYEEAIRYFTQAINQDPTYLEAVFDRGQAFELQGELDNARQDFAYTLHLNPKYEPAIEALNRLDRK
ncbi:MAG: tetratricopeptide repeat protein [Bacteroidales bacterium]|nr:tetratricopeptide repeat protein [Bacteroidales bacterium]